MQAALNTDPSLYGEHPSTGVGPIDPARDRFEFSYARSWNPTNRSSEFAAACNWHPGFHDERFPDLLPTAPLLQAFMTAAANATAMARPRSRSGA